LGFNIEESTSLEGVSQRSCSTSFWHQDVKLMETMLILVGAWRMDSFWDEAMCHVWDIHGVDIFKDYASQSIVVHFLIWDPEGGVYDGSSLDGTYCVCHRWTWDPDIVFGWV
jgi:hypothetical protein